MPKKIDPEFKLISLSATKLSGCEAYQIIAIGKCGNKEEGILHKSLTRHTVKDVKLYVISYHAEPDKFDDYLDTINMIMGSFKIK